MVNLPVNHVYCLDDYSKTYLINLMTNLNRIKQVMLVMLTEAIHLDQWRIKEVVAFKHKGTKILK